MKKIVFCFALSLTLSLIFAQNPDRIYESHKEENSIFSVTTNDGTYFFRFYSKDILETSFVPSGELRDTSSHAVIMKPKEVPTTYGYFDKDIVYATNGISVTITTAPFKVTYKYKGQPLVSEKRGYYKANHEPMELVQGNIVGEKTEAIELNVSPSEVLYGGGARALGMNRRGHRLPLYNRAHYGYETRSELMNFTMPIVVSSKQYMIHFDNAPIGYLDLDSKSNNTITYETISGKKTYQIIAGDSWEALLNNYTNLTGKQPMPPRWALGNFASRFGYHSQKEVEATIDKYIQEDIPVDAVILDLYWFGKDIQGTMGNLRVFRDSFPEFEQMVNRVKRQGVKTIVITEPFVLSSSKRWQEAVSSNILALDSIGNPATYDFYFGNTGIIDIYKPKGETWFWNIYKELANKGVQGVWGDLGEPEVLPSWVNFAAGMADEIHNIYGHDWARLLGLTLKLGPLPSNSSPMSAGNH